LHHIGVQLKVVIVKVGVDAGLEYANFAADDDVEVVARLAYLANLAVVFVALHF
jgi:hypothetical protein